MFSRKIGVIGGLGPVASAYFYQRLLYFAQKDYEAIQDGDYPTIIIYSLSSNHTSEYGIKDIDEFKKELLHASKSLEEAGADFIVVVCNGVYRFYDEISKWSELPILNLPKLMLDEILEKKVSRILLLAASETYDSAIYQNIFQNSKIELIVPNNDIRMLTTQIIKNAMSGKVKNNLLNKLIKQIEVTYTDIDAIILGCTELPVVLRETPFTVFDTIDILAKKSLEFSR